MNDFHVVVSVDGDQKTHDKNRKYTNGKQTYTDVSRNIGLFVNRGVRIGAISYTMNADNWDIDEGSFVSSMKDFGVNKLNIQVDKMLPNCNRSFVFNKILKLINICSKNDIHVTGEFLDVINRLFIYGIKNSNFISVRCTYHSDSGIIIDNLGKLQDCAYKPAKIRTKEKYIKNRIEFIKDIKVRKQESTKCFFWPLFGMCQGLCSDIVNDANCELRRSFMNYYLSNFKEEDHLILDNGDLKSFDYLER